jgi:Flp pilus assembly protein TadG
MFLMTKIRKAVLLRLRSGLKDERGAVAIMVALLMTVFLGFGALAIDLSHLYVARNELQNAADAGALAGARFLYNDDGTEVNDDGFVDSDGNAHAGANQIAYDAATANQSEKTAVEVNWTSGNEGDVQRGHWCFATGDFTANASTDAVDLWNVSSEDLDNNPDFINAVKVVTRRQATPIVSFFARIFGYPNFQLSAEAIAYLGFAGNLQSGDVDQPIAICRESLLIDGDYSCSIGRMINSGQNVESSETGGWTSFSQDDPCTGGTNAQEVKSLVCGEGNPEIIHLGEPMATNGGDIQSAFNDLYQCWVAATGKTGVWNLTLPVVSCPGNNVGTCEEVRGAVNLNIVWITGAGEDPSYNDAPTQMGDWSSSDPNGAERWTSFVGNFDLQNVDGSPAPYAKKSIYFLPDCTPHEPKGGSGGENFGILAKIPKLVK